MRPRTLIKDHETAYIRNQIDSVRHVFGYVVRPDAAVIRKSMGVDEHIPYEGATYLVKHGFNSHGEHTWNGGWEI